MGCPKILTPFISRAFLPVLFLGLGCGGALVPLFQGDPVYEFLPLAVPGLN